MAPPTEPRSMAWSFPFVPQDWERTPTAHIRGVRLNHTILAHEGSFAML
jgi:hypothetical protein